METRRSLSSTTPPTSSKVDFLAAKLSAASPASSARGHRSGCWTTRDARQYLDCTVEDLAIASKELAAQGLLHWSSDPEYGVSTPKLMERRDAYLAELAHALQAIKPAFNEEMRSGLTNM